MIFKKTFRTILVTLGLCLLAGCASNTSGPRTAKQSAYSANQYLQMANNAEGLAKQGYLLQAANQFINEQQLARAQDVYNQVSDTLPPNLRIKKQLISAELLMAYNQPANALTTLQSMNKDHASWTRRDQIEWYQLAARANQKLGNINASISQRSAIVALLPGDQQKAQLLTIWQTLENISAARIRSMLDQATNNDVKGWLSLAIITDRANSTPQILSQQLQHWKNEYPNHPASALLPANMRQLSMSSSNHPQHIALLLPMTGRYASAGKAIRNGFFAAYYNAKKQGKNTPEITVIDTGDKPITTAYQEAVSKGANFVVGPLV
ncbi:MAG: penicillin-binding protein activator, partial [Coxiellaceae bacterium]|nr:penicillin-binding protein activator [Coxiellaceae bacterium]